MQYLVTFKTTTAALRAAHLAKGKLESEVIPVPFQLSRTCYGMGLSIKSDSAGMEGFCRDMKDSSIDYRRVWQVEDEDFIPWKVNDGERGYKMGIPDITPLKDGDGDAE